MAVRPACVRIAVGAALRNTVGPVVPGEDGMPGPRAQTLGAPSRPRAYDLRRLQPREPCRRQQEEEMIRPSTEIRSATPDEMSEAIAAIVAAFLTDPVARFALPSPHAYFRGMPLATREFAGGSFEHGTAYV